MPNQIPNSIPYLRCSNDLLTHIKSSIPFKKYSHSVWNKFAFDFSPQQKLVYLNVDLEFLNWIHFKGTWRLYNVETLQCRACHRVSSPKNKTSKIIAKRVFSMVYANNIIFVSTVLDMESLKVRETSKKKRFVEILLYYIHFDLVMTWSYIIFLNICL